MPNTSATNSYYNRHRPSSYGTGTDQRFQRAHGNTSTTDAWGTGASNNQVLSEVKWPQETKAWINVFAQHFPALQLTPLPARQGPVTDEFPYGSHTFTYIFYDYRLQQRRDCALQNCKVECSGTRNKKSEAQLVAALQVVAELESLKLIPSPRIVQRPTEQDYAWDKLEDSSLRNEMEGYGEKEAKRRLQDLCKFLSIPIPYENMMLGSQQCTDKRAKCCLTLYMPAAPEKMKKLGNMRNLPSTSGNNQNQTPINVYTSEAYAKGEQEAIQKVSLDIIRQLVADGWLLSKSEQLRIEPELNLSFMRKYFSDDIKPAYVDTFNVYGGHWSFGCEFFLLVLRRCLFISTCMNSNPLHPPSS